MKANMLNNIQLTVITLCIVYVNVRSIFISIFIVIVLTTLTFLTKINN